MTRESTQEQETAAAKSKTAKLVGLFTATVLAFSSGCSYYNPLASKHIHIDNNHDGYCDEDGQPMPRGSGGGGHYYGGSGTYGSGGTQGGGSAGEASPAGMSTAAKGGIGGHAAGSGGG